MTATPFSRITFNQCLSGGEGAAFTVWRRGVAATNELPVLLQRSLNGFRTSKSMGEAGLLPSRPAKNSMIWHERHIGCLTGGVFRTISTILPLFTLVLAQASAFADATNIEEEVRLLREHNAILPSQVQKQDKALDTLNGKIQKLEGEEMARAIAAGENPPAEHTGYDIGSEEDDAPHNLGGLSAGRRSLNFKSHEG